MGTLAAGATPRSTVQDLAARIEDIFARDGYDSYRGEMVPLAYTFKALTEALNADSPAGKGAVLLALQSLRSAGKITSRPHYPSGETLYRRPATTPTPKGN